MFSPCTVRRTLARRVCRECGLSSSGKSEEKRRLTICSNVRRTVHGENISQRQQKIHYAEDGLLHFARILRASNQHDLAREISQNEGARLCPVPFGHRDR